jgi:4'-phosphopantetheinyl transferase
MPVAAAPPLAGGCCQVWWAELPVRNPRLPGLLDCYEQQRYLAYRRSQDRDRFLVGAALLRLVLASHLGIAPAAVPIDRSCLRCGRPHGKPVLRDGADFELSVAHSGKWVVVAVAREIAVGVDVERVDAHAVTSEVARLTLTSEEHSELDGLATPVRTERFFSYWTRKEALVKALGCGLEVPLHAIDVRRICDPPRGREFAGQTPLSAGICLVDLAPRAGYAASLAVAARQVRLRELDGSAVLAAA